jgi:hypothetical protein
MIRVERVPPAGAGEIAAFVAAHPAATAYAAPAWLDVVERFSGASTRYLAATLDGRLAGVLPIAERPVHPRAALLPAWARPLRLDSLGDDAYAGPLLDPSLSSDAAARVLDALIESLADPRVVLRTLFVPAWADLDPMRRRLVEVHGYHPVRAYPSAVKPLVGLTAATLPATYHKKHRNALSAATARGVVVAPARDAGDYLEFSDLYEETMARAGLAGWPTKDLIVDGGAALARAGIGELLLARADGVPAAGMFVLRAGGTAVYWLGASARDEKAQQCRPMNALLHRAFCDALAAGCSRFELGGLTVPGIRMFKTRWGVEEYQQPTYEWSRAGLAPLLRGASARVLGWAQGGGGRST